MYFNKKQLFYIHKHINLLNVDLNVIEFTDLLDQCRKCRLNIEEPIFNVRTLEQLQQLLANKSSDEMIRTLYVHHKDGYTYLHFLFWNYAVERQKHRNPEFAHQCKKMIEYLMTIPEVFMQLCNYGTIDDNGNTPIHDYIKYISSLKAEDIKFIDLLRQSGVNFGIQDKDGMNIDDYIQLKRLSPEIKRKIQFKQVQMKQWENELVNHITESYPQHFKRCTCCNKILYLYYDIDHLPIEKFQLIMNEDLLWKMCNIIVLREDIMKLYLQYSHNEINVLDNHNFTIDVWKRKVFHIMKE